MFESRTGKLKIKTPKLTTKTIMGALFLLLVLFSCTQEKAKEKEAISPLTGIMEEAETRTTRSGPVTATVSLSPKEAKIGDPLTLILKVTAEKDVTVEMPAFGEALGRFAILDFAPSSRLLPQGDTEYVQRYSLDAPMSGVKTIPPLRIEFTDRRSSQATASLGGEDNIHELLTEKISIEIASVLPAGKATDQLRPARGRLQKRFSAQEKTLAVSISVGLLLTLLAVYIIWKKRQHRTDKKVRSAFEVASERLSRLEKKGLPDAAQADTWYVELSSIVRTYIEDRYGLKAPELTTEEFIRAVGKSESIAKEHRPLLNQFLERCDRVKFAGYRPGTNESAEAIASAARFLEETRILPVSQQDSEKEVRHAAH